MGMDKIDNTTNIQSIIDKQYLKIYNYFIKESEMYINLNKNYYKYNVKQQQTLVNDLIMISDDLIYARKELKIMLNKL